MKQRVIKKAFTMLELIFVIVILGIIAGGTFIQISTVYEDLIQKQNTGELQAESKFAIEQIVSRLSGTIKESLVVLKDASGNGCKSLNDLLPDDNSENLILAWVGKSDESNMGLWDTDKSDYMGWSGFVDLDDSNAESISTKGSMLSSADTIINDLTGDTMDNVAAIYFSGSSTDDACNDFDLDSALDYQNSKMYKVKRNGDITFDKNDKDFENISERYSLSHAAYAVERNKTDSTLWLRSFRPWKGEHPNSSNAKSYLLAKNVSKFGFKPESGGILRLNICIKKTMPGGYDIEVCKEKMIF